MAKFAKGDWVRVTPTPDTDSDVWTSSHNKYCDKIGQIIDVNDMYDDMLLLRVSVHFQYKQSYLTGEHSAWFEDKHIIKSSKWESDRIEFLSKQFEEYKRSEESIKRRRDKILKDIFTDPAKEEREKAKKEKAKKLKEAKEAIDAIKDIEEKRDMEDWIPGDGWFVKDFDDF